MIGSGRVGERERLGGIGRLPSSKRQMCAFRSSIRDINAPRNVLIQGMALREWRGSVATGGGIHKTHYQGVEMEQPTSGDEIEGVENLTKWNII